MNALLGVIFHFIGGFASGSFYMPYKKVKGWNWESFWIVGGLFSWLIVPPLAAYITIPGFVEIIKTNLCGQISYFTMKVGVSRGNHYHHTKVEKFLVVVGEIKFKMINIVTDEEYVIYSSSVEPKIIESIPGWNHSIENIGDIDAVVILWSSEIFSEINPDTYIL
jgi:mannose-6-phosphate isomerase-like protein (cupin superfamily)